MSLSEGVEIVQDELLVPQCDSKRYVELLVFLKFERRQKEGKHQDGQLRGDRFLKAATE